MADPFPIEDTEPANGVRISLSGKTGTGHEAGLINVSGTEAEVAAFLRLDTADPAYQASPFSTIVGRWNQGHVWAQGDYKRAQGGKAPGKA